MRLLLLALLWLAGKVRAGEDALARLERQVDELRRQREDDRAQVEWARAELERVRGERDASSQRLASQCQATARWLREQLEHVQSEMRELASAHNVSARLRREGATDTRLRLLERGLAETRHELHKARVSLADHAQRLKQAEGDAQEMRGKQLKPIHMQMEELQEQVRSLGTTIAIPQKRVSLDNNVWDGLLDAKPGKNRLRHHGGIRALRQDLHLLATNHSSLAASFQQWKKQVSQSENATVSDVRNHLASLEKALANVSSWASGVSQLRSSTVQLFEAVAELQDESGRKAGQVQQELAHLEADLMQAAAASNADRKSLRNRVESVRAGLLQDQDSIKALRRDEPKRLMLHEIRLVQLEEHVSRLQEAMHHINASAFPQDCKDVTTSAIVSVLPPGLGHFIEVQCQIDETGVAWTVIQDRKERDTGEFDRDWNEYSKGFGSPARTASGSWIGNKALHALTANAHYAIRFELWDKDNFRFAQYDKFHVDDETRLYRIHIGSYHGNASDAMQFHDGMAFSTRDADHDTSSEHCAKDYRGGWWYGHCEHANLNGRGPLGLTWYDARTQQWLPLTKARIKIRRMVPQPPT